MIIPTHGRPDKVVACLDRLLPLRQSLDPKRYEVLIGFDGAEPETERRLRQHIADNARRVGRPEFGSGAPSPAWGGVHLEACPREGYNAVRNRLLPKARGRLLLSINDDVLPGEHLLQAHVDAHLQRQRASAEPASPDNPAATTSAVIVGCCPWVVHQPDRIIDRLVRETSMVFFYDQMDDRDPHRDWGFRHAWGMNMSMPLAMVREVGGFTAFPLAYGYDDLELAYRLQQRFGVPVLYRPQAVAPHDHRYEPIAYLERERSLGRSAWLFAQHNAEFARTLFGRDIASQQEVTYSREFVARERAAAERMRETFAAVGQLPASVLDHAGSTEADPQRISRLLARTIYEQHLLLKRWMWRSGLLEAAGE